MIGFFNVTAQFHEIVSDPEILGGTPVFRGTRVPFDGLLDYLKSGHNIDEFVDDFPTVTRAQAERALTEALETAEQIASESIA